MMLFGVVSRLFAAASAPLLPLIPPLDIGDIIDVDSLSLSHCLDLHVSPQSYSLPKLHALYKSAEVRRGPTEFSSHIGTKLRDWAIGQAGAGCDSHAGLSSNDSKTRY